MINNCDLNYVCTTISNLSGLPVRLFNEDKNELYYSPVHLILDPFENIKEQVLLLKEKVTYYRSSFFYYGIINFDNYSVVVGPTSQIPISKQELKEYAFSINVSYSLIDDFVIDMESLPNVSLLSLLQILCLTNYFITGEKISLESIAIHESEQNIIKDEIEKDDVSRKMRASNEPYVGLDTENRLLDMIMRGDVAALNEFTSRIPVVKSGTVAKEQLRQAKNIFIVTATLASRAAIRGGLDVTTSLALSDSYIQRCELADSPDIITELNYRMVIDYAERVAKLKLGQNPSILVIKVSNYIQQHLSEPIKVEDISKALFMGRSRLSTNFKKETGINISDYIINHKIDEAKRLLRYSDKSLTAISLYLGFTSQSHFTKVFKEKVGTTPSEYKLMHKHY